MKKISIVIPVYNEEKVLEILYSKIKNITNENNKLKAISFSRNFG